MALKSSKVTPKTPAPLSITRRALGQALSFIGGAALVIGLVGLVWQSGVTLPVGIALIVAVIGLGGWALISPDEARAFVTGRGARHSTVSVFSTLLLIGVVAMTFVLLQRGAITLDMTESRRFTLSEQSLAILARITRPMQITGFYTARALPRREIDDQFFRLYESTSEGRVRRQYIDPQEQPALADRFGVSEDGQIFLSYLNDDGSIDFNTIARVPLGETQERDMTEAISRLLIAGTVTIYFETMHGERDPLDASQEGISGINAGMQETGFITQQLNLPALGEGGGDIPADADAVIFARPTSDLTQAEIDVLDRYLAAGGSLLIMADPLYNENAFLQEDGLFNNYLWTTWGIRARDAVVVDEGSRGQTALDVIGAIVFSQSAITQRLEPETSPTLFRLVRPLDVDFETQRADVGSGALILSSDVSYAETDLVRLSQTNTYEADPATDFPGPLPLAVYANNTTTRGRIVLIGDSDFVTNGLVLTGDNGILFTDALTWLTDYNERLGFGFQGYATGLPLVLINNAGLATISFITVIGIPGALVLAGIIVGLRRRRRAAS